MDFGACCFHALTMLEDLKRNQQSSSFNCRYYNFEFLVGIKVI
uniref:Uncharacterized protein n=1 Tax=Arundo donax TaxID=35708 RepID=A0A0A9A5W6_ARUDO